MRDKSLGIFLMVLLGVGGITILILTWSQTMLLTDRIMSTFVGSIGLFVATVRALLLRAMPAEIIVGKVEPQDSIKENILVEDNK